MQVRVKNSPYYSVKKGAVGKVIGRKFQRCAEQPCHHQRCGQYEVWRVFFHGGATWSFRPPRMKVNGQPELEVRNGKEV